MAHKMTHTRSDGLSALETGLTYVEQQSEASASDVLMFRRRREPRGEKTSIRRQADINDISFLLNVVCT